MKTETSPQLLAPALAALARYDRRQARLERPTGRNDNGNRWYAEGRDAEVLSSVREPSRLWPLSQFKACQALPHCERYENADHAVVLAVRRKLKSLGVQANDLAAFEALGLPAPDADVARVMTAAFAVLKLRAERQAACAELNHAYHAAI